MSSTKEATLRLYAQDLYDIVKQLSEYPERGDAMRLSELAYELIATIDDEIAGVGHNDPV